MQSVYGALAWDDYELLWDSISEDKAKSDEQGQGILPGKFTPGHTPEMSLLPARGRGYAEACTIGTGLAGCEGIYVAKKRQFWWQNAPILCLQQDASL